jgi:hypothetical protein
LLVNNLSAAALRLNKNPSNSFSSVLQHKNQNRPVNLSFPAL